MIMECRVYCNGQFLGVVELDMDQLKMLTGSKTNKEMITNLVVLTPCQKEESGR